MNNDWILDKVVEGFKFRLSTLEKMLQDEGFQPVYKAALRQEIIWLKEQLNEVDEMKLEDIRESDLADEDYRENRAYSQI